MVEDRLNPRREQPLKQHIRAHILNNRLTSFIPFGYRKLMSFIFCESQKSAKRSCNTVGSATDAQHDDMMSKSKYLFIPSKGQKNIGFWSLYSRIYSRISSKRRTSRNTSQFLPLFSDRPAEKRWCEGLSNFILK